MSMTKQDFIALADMIKGMNDAEDKERFKPGQVAVLADFCQQLNPRFNRARWLGYIAGTNGPSGGRVK